ncbi:MAG TPA: ACT domain-containing protein [Candidatus Limnocylindrales bacterium]|jgi:hypothetical protein
MHAFLIDLDNKPGTLADVADALGRKGINIENIAGATCGDHGRVAVVTADDAGARQALRGIGATFDELETVEASLANKPGSLAEAARRLADAGVNIEAILPAGMSGGNVTASFVTKDAARARDVLSTVTASR